MDTFFAILFALWIGFSGATTLVFNFGDYRLFDDIQKQCETQGYIQNKTTRIICKKEKQND